MKVRAIQDCFLDNCYRKAGEVFDYNGPMPPKTVQSPIIPAGDFKALAEAPKRFDPHGREILDPPTWTTPGYVQAHEQRQLTPAEQAQVDELIS